MRWSGAIALAGAVATAVTWGGYELTGADGDDALGPGAVTVTLDVEYSRFSAERLVVREGTLVTFVVRNRDPIDHEFIIGGRDVHARHARGTEQAHPPVPGEVSVGPGETGATIYSFDEPGTFEFACHLPRHLEYGMRGSVVVEGAS